MDYNRLHVVIYWTIFSFYRVLYVSPETLYKNTSSCITFYIMQSVFYPQSSLTKWKVQVGAQNNKKNFLRYFAGVLRSHKERAVKKNQEHAPKKTKNQQQQKHPKTSTKKPQTKHTLPHRSCWTANSICIIGLTTPNSQCMRNAINTTVLSDHNNTQYQYFNALILLSHP